MYIFAGLRSRKWYSNFSTEEVNHSVHSSSRDKTSKCSVLMNCWFRTKNRVWICIPRRDESLQMAAPNGNVCSKWMKGIRQCQVGSARFSLLRLLVFTGISSYNPCFDLFFAPQPFGIYQLCFLHKKTILLFKVFSVYDVTLTSQNMFTSYPYNSVYFYYYLCYCLRQWYF